MLKTFALATMLVALAAHADEPCVETLTRLMESQQGNIDEPFVAYYAGCTREGRELQREIYESEDFSTVNAATASLRPVLTTVRAEIENSCETLDELLREGLSAIEHDPELETTHPATNALEWRIRTKISRCHQDGWTQSASQAFLSIIRTRLQR